MTDLTADRLRELLRYDATTGKFYWLDRPRSEFKTPQAYGSFKSNYCGKEAGGTQGNGYIRFTIDGKHYLAHRLAWLYEHGEWPKGQIDHISGDYGDNSILNIRDIPAEENQRNMKRAKNNTSGVTGVRFDGRYGTWKATIWANASRLNLGSFKNKGDAVAARKAAERRLGYHPNHGRVQIAAE